MDRAGAHLRRSRPRAVRGARSRAAPGVRAHPHGRHDRGVRPKAGTPPVARSGRRPGPAHVVDPARHPGPDDPPPFAGTPAPRPDRSLPDPALGQGQHVEGAVELVGGHQPALEHDLADRAPGLHALLDDLGRLLVADVGVERRADRRARLGVGPAALDVRPRCRRRTGRRTRGSTLASRRIDSSRLRAITGRYTLSSKLPWLPANATAASLPITCAAHLGDRLGHDRVDLAGHDRRARAAGRGCGSRPGRCAGPMPIQRMSLAILMSDDGDGAAAGRDISTSASRAPCAAKWSGASTSGRSMSSASRLMTLRAKVFGALMPVPTAVPPSGSSPDARQRVARCARSPSLDLRGVAAELLAEGHRRGVHEVGAARLHDRSEPLRAPAAQRRARGARARGAAARSIDAHDGEVDGRREHVVGRLRRVDVVVRVDRRSRAARRRARRSPRSCSCSTTCPTRSGRRRSGSGRPTCPSRPRRAASWMASPMSFGITFSRPLTVAAAPLIEASAPISSRSMRRARDREVLDRPLGLRPPAGVGGHPHLAHGVVLDPELVARRCACVPGRHDLPLCLPFAAVSEFAYQELLPLGPDDTRVPPADHRRRVDGRGGRPPLPAGRAGGAHARWRREAMRDIAHLLRPATSQQLRGHPRRSRGVGQRPLRRARPAEERQHRRRRRAAHVPGHRHRHRDGQAGPARAHRRRRRGRHRPRHPRHLRRRQPALLADGAAHDVGGEQHRHQPAGPDRALRHRRRRLQVPVHGQGRRVGQQELPVPGDQGAAQPRAADGVPRREAPHARHRGLPAVPPRDRHRRHVGRVRAEDGQVRVGPVPRHAADQRATSSAAASATSSSSAQVLETDPAAPASARSSAASTSATTCGSSASPATARRARSPSP